MIEKNILTTADLGYGNLVTLDDDTKLLAKVQYELISDVDFTTPFGGHIEFKAGEKIKVTGLLAEKVLLYGKTKGIPVRLFSKTLQKQRDVNTAVIDNQLKVAELEKKLETLMSSKEEIVSESEVISKPKKKASKKKITKE